MAEQMEGKTPTGLTGNPSGQPETLPKPTPNTEGPNVANLLIDKLS